jgi:hypothetical protein
MVGDWLFPDELPKAAVEAAEFFLHVQEGGSIRDDGLDF